MWTGSRKPTKDVITPQGKKKRVQRGEGRKDCVGSKGQSHLEQVTLCQYSCLENSMDRRAWWATVHGVTESDMTERLTHTCMHLFIYACMPRHAGY